MRWLAGWMIGMAGLAFLGAGCSTTPEVTATESPALETRVTPQDLRSEWRPADDRIQNDRIDESSGLVRGHRFPDVVWTHNDSGDGPRIFAMTPEGYPVGNPEGVRIDGASAIDWEDIASDGRGHLVIGDVGNNGNARRDLRLYVITEPDPLAPTVPILARYKVSYPDQSEFPPGKRNFDCEAVFVADGTIYFLTKHRSDNDTKLYALRDPRTDRPNVLEFLARFPIDGQVTAADVTSDGQSLAILTYRRLWVFERTSPGPTWFEGSVRAIALDMRQCEAVAWLDDQTLLVSNEQRDLYRVPLDTLTDLTR